MADDSELAGLVGNIVFTGLYEHLSEAVQGVESCRDVIRHTLTQHGAGLPRQTRLIQELQWVTETLQSEMDSTASDSQLAGDACLGLIPVVDQLQDTRDLFAHCRLVHHDTEDPEAWVTLALTLVGLSTILASPAKGILKLAVIHTQGKSNVGNAVADGTRSIASFIAAPNSQSLMGPVNPSLAIRRAADAIDLLKAELSISRVLETFDAWLTQVEDIRLWANKQMTPFMHQWWDAHLMMARSVRALAPTKLTDSSAATMATLEGIKAALLRMADQLDETLAGTFGNVSPDTFRERHRESIANLSANLKCILGELST
ncbi:hypothetical protein [Halomonas huangheensis]|uniref:Uncharacterized protein n=1 Tax=Halomonas huangheensis TaxID=1178482 RepID=W1NAT8_9GAMM|nr:hypothetical protein [Halomonas huangheensis]ALM52435.1 hypothetical protein AR456_09180 [Halomonas huangheensis]ERL52644.1 hypothetical protein BJB45_18875 [Halomonas huangheensis]